MADNYYKYKKYCDKINILKGGRYECKPKEAFKDICVETKDGKYKNKEKCINDCENNYIRHNLIISNLEKESYKFHKFIKDIISQENFNVYIKGGNVIGLKILRMIYDEYKNDDAKFKKYFEKFLDLNLIKDWDFASYTDKEITKDYREKLDGISEKYKLVPRAKTFILYQTKYPIKIEDKELFEISLLDSETYGSMEIPLTTMKIKVTEHNVKYIFILAKFFYANAIKKEEFDMDLIRRVMEKTKIIIHPHRNGFYETKELDKSELNDELLNFIKKYEKYDANLPQFLITHIKDPFRLLYRLVEKNIPKTQKIIKFLEEIYKDMRFIDWLFEPEFVEKIIEQFTNDFGDELLVKYKDGGLKRVNEFIEGIYWIRTEIEYTKLFTDKSKKLLNNMLKKLVLAMGEKEIGELKEDNKFYKLLKIINKN